MITAKQVLEYTKHDLDFDICKALIKSSEVLELKEGVLRNWVVCEIKKAHNPKEINLDPKKVSQRLNALYKLNIIKNVKRGSNLRWFYNTGFTFENLIQTQSTKKAVIDIEVIKPKVVITNVNAVNPNTKPVYNLDNKLLQLTSNAITSDVIHYKSRLKGPKILNIVNNNSPRNPQLQYYFVRYKGLVNTKTQFQRSEVIALPFKVYTEDHIIQIENQLLDTIPSAINADQVQLILINCI